MCTGMSRWGGQGSISFILMLRENVFRNGSYERGENAAFSASCKTSGGLLAQSPQTSKYSLIMCSYFIINNNNNGVDALLTA